jgi:dTDP-4-dehydrorhamnose reductase
MSTVLILGATGMLGSAVLREFSNFRGKVLASTRGNKILTSDSSVTFFNFDAATDDLETSFPMPVDFVINCIGIIKPYINDKDPRQTATAMELNGTFPNRLEVWASKRGAKVIQIATDCVFSGSKGNYLESDEHNALDVYGKSKSLGEAKGPSMMHLRVSIIGPEVDRNTSLLEWVRNQPLNSDISGYTDHFWNGITSLHFSKMALGIVENDLFEAGVFHVLPQGSVTKFELVSLIAKHLGRSDIKVNPTVTGANIDRTLDTEFPAKNKSLWLSAGYDAPPSFDQMLSELIAAGVTRP